MNTVVNDMGGAEVVTPERYSNLSRMNDKDLEREYRKVYERFESTRKDMLELRNKKQGSPELANQYENKSAEYEWWKVMYRMLHEEIEKRDKEKRFL